MNDALQVQKYSEADFSLSDQALVDNLEMYLESLNVVPCKGSLFLDLGCGPGNITERLGNKWPDATVVGIDGSSEMVAIARQKNEQRNKKARISYFSKNISSLASERLINRLSPDVIISNSLLHHLHDPSVLWDCLKILSKKGTVFYHRDLRRPSSVEKVRSLQKKYLPNSHPILVRDYIASLKAAFTVNEVRNQLDKANIKDFKVFEIDDCYLEVFGKFK